jgi:hypothetical protein
MAIYPVRHDIVTLKRHDIVAIALVEAAKKHSTKELVAASALQRPSWWPTQLAAGGDAHCPLTRHELAAVGSVKGAVELEKEWSDIFNSVVDMNVVLNSPCGPQRESEMQIATAIRCGTVANLGDLADKSPSSCLMRGDCERFGESLLRVGDVVCDTVCRELRKEKNRCEW